MPVVERGDLCDAQSLGDGDDGGVGGAEREVGVGLDEGSHPGEVDGFEGECHERAVGK